MTHQTSSKYDVNYMDKKVRSQDLYCSIFQHETNFMFKQINAEWRLWYRLKILTI